MHSDEDDSLTLSKWPFYLGDVLLVATALAIAILGEWNLSDWQVASCVIAVALGAGLFVLPFVVEFYMRASETADDHSAETRQLERQLENVAALLRACDERLDALESDSNSSASSDELLIASVDQKLASIEVFKSEQAAALDDLKRQLEALKARLEKPSPDEAALDALKAIVGELEARISQIGGPDESIELRLKALETAQAEAAAAKVPVEPVKERPVRAPRQRRKSDAGLLHRAIKEKPDSARSAVSRIIHSKKHEAASPEPVEEPVEEPESIEATAGQVAVETAAAEPETTDEAPVETSEPAPPPVETAEAAEPVTVDDFPENIEVSLGAELIEDDALLESPQPPEEEEPAAAPDRQDEAAVEPVDAEEKEEPVDDTVEAPAAQPAAAEDLFGEVAASSARRIRTKKNDTILTVSILIGIGNKPFLRGSGGGLSWDTGIPMDFEEIGKWRWIAPADLEEPLELQVYRNDEDADRKGKHVLEPGQKLEVTPVF